MPSTSTVTGNLIQSYVGFKRPDRSQNSGVRGGFSAPRPVLQTVRTLDGVETAITGETTSTRMLYVPPLQTFEYPVNSTSTVQTVTIKNSGTEAIIIYEIAPYSSWVETTTIINYPTSIPPYTISSGSSYSFNLSYYSNIIGQFNELITITSDAVFGTYYLNTFQDVYSRFNARHSPSTVTFTTTVIGLQSSTSIQLVPVINGVDDYDITLDFTTSLTGSPGWSITTATNLVNLTWDPDYINNTTGTYTSTLSISVEGIALPFVTTSTAYVNIDFERYRNLSTWLSPIAGNNSMIGVSLDMFDGIETVTIGVGAGGDGTPIYSEGGSIFAILDNLNLRAASIDTPYPYWATVCKIPLPRPGTYLSGALDDNGVPQYIKKTTSHLNYADYFGFDQSEGSMFIVDYDGYDAVNIRINNLRSLSGDTAFDGTLQNLTRAFHYYSEKDSPGRFNNLPQYPFTTSTVYTLSTSTTPLPPGETRTYLFRGFTASHVTATSVWSVDVGIVPIPT
jgi:hypothetical protein